MEFTPLKQWIPGEEVPLIIAGPCSAESEFQVLETARRISKIKQVKVFRAGIWKPRTRPGAFEGVGRKGLAWLKKAKEETGLMLTVEVAKPSHVEEALEYGVDILWIGARTVVNPFSMQELSESLSGIDIPVMIKNPVNPDLKLWIGAIERLSKTGHNRVAAIHRGFSQFEKSSFRYPPHWEIPIELMRQMPGLPLICDPSHISGNVSNIPYISQQALDLEMQGLMVETHFDPANALTDAQQQLTPELLEKMIEELVIRSPRGNVEFERSLEELRREIDLIDDDMINLLSKRMKIAKEMGKYKHSHGITILQLRRWKELFDDRVSKGIKKGLDKNFLTNLLRLVHEESIQIQTNVMNSHKDTEQKDL
jgi:chorismate mutase